MVKLSPFGLSMSCQADLVVSSTTPVTALRFAASASKAGDGTVLSVCRRTLDVLEPRRIIAVPAPAAPPGTLTVFVASVGVSVVPDTVHFDATAATTVGFGSVPVRSPPSVPFHAAY